MKDHKLLYFKRVVNWLLNHIYRTVILLLVAISFVMHNEVESIFDNIYKRISNNTLAEGVLINVLAWAFTFLLALIISLILGKGKYQISIQNIKRHIYIFLSKIPSQENSKLKALRLLIINIFLDNSLLNLPEQYSNLDKLEKNVIGKVNSNFNEINNVTWIDGKGHSGKTTLILQFIDSIAKRTELFNLFDQRIYYFDFADSKTSCTQIREDIISGNFTDSLIIFDNIHKLDSSNIMLLTNLIITYSRKVKYLIVLSRPLKEFCYSQELYSRLKDFIENNTERLEISSVETGNITTLLDIKACINVIESEDKNVYKKFLKFCNKIKLPLGEIQEAALIIHLYKIFSFSKSDEIAQLIFSTLTEKSEESDLAMVLSFIVHSAMFCGVVDETNLHNFLRNQDISKKGFKWLKILLRLHFIEISYVRKERKLVFHERLARYYFSLISNNREFSSINESVISCLFYDSQKSGNDVFAWKYYICLSNTLFDKVINRANYLTLRDDLHDIIMRKSLTVSYFHRELGIIYDRMGEMNNAAEKFKAIYAMTNDPQIYINLVQANHQEYIKVKMEALYADTNPYVALASRYWVQHMEIHIGNFNFDALREIFLLKREEIDYAIVKANYDGWHLLRRGYFDCYRNYYLSGIFNPKLIVELKNSELRCILSDYMKEEFVAYEDKFLKAHFIHYDLLSTLTLFEKLTETNQLFNNQIQYVKEILDIYDSQLEKYDTPDKLIDEATTYYQSAYDYFYRVSDKTYRYVQLRISELKLARSDFNHEQLKEVLYSIKQFIVNSKSVKIDEYVAYGYTYMLKALLVGQFLSPQTQEYNNDSISFLTYDEDITNCFIKISKFHKSYMPKTPNKYGLFRLDLYQTLYDLLRNKENAEMKLKNLLQCSVENRYFREKLIINEFLVTNGSNLRYKIWNFFRYYPIVLQ